MTARVSVVIPTYNRVEFLRHAVDSVFAQTCEDIELIVVDDGSHDSTLDMLASYGDARLRVVQIEHSGIPGHVRNMGLQAAQGELVAFLDSDDVWFPTKIDRQVTVFARDPAIGLVCSNARVIDGKGDDLGGVYLRADLEPTGTEFEDLLEVNFVVNSSAMVRRTLVEQVGRFSESPELRSLEDYDLWLRVAAVSQVVYLPEPLMLYREHGESVRRDFSRCEHWAGLLAILDNVAEFLDEDDDRKRTLIARRRAEPLVRLAAAQLAEARPRAAARSLVAALKDDPGKTASLLVIRPIVHLPRWARQGATAAARLRPFRSRNGSESRR